MSSDQSRMGAGHVPGDDAEDPSNPWGLSYQTAQHNALPATSPRMPILPPVAPWGQPTEAHDPGATQEFAVPGHWPTDDAGWGESATLNPPAPPEDEEALLAACSRDLDQLESEAQELQLLLKQSQQELETLTTRRALAESNLQEMEPRLEHYSRQEIRATYVAAAETEMRAFMINEQREAQTTKLRTYERYMTSLRRMISYLHSATRTAQGTLGGRRTHGAFTSTAGLPSLRGLPTKREAVPAMPPMPATTRQLPVVRADARGGTLQGEVSVLGRVIQSEEEIRKRVARVLHDGPVQTLANMMLTVEICEKLLKQDPARAREELQSLKELVSGALQDTRKVMYDLRPTALDDLGLLPALQRYCADLAAQHQVVIQVLATGSEYRLPAPVEIPAFRVAQEALLNALHHGRATHIQVRLAIQPDGVVLQVEDNGAGFDVEEALTRAASRHSTGLASMQERAEMLGGWLRVTSEAGRGTLVELRAPILA